MLSIFPKRYSLLKASIILFLSLSFFVRLIFLIWNFNQTTTGFIEILQIFGVGFFYDLGTVSFFALVYALYLLLWPMKFYGSLPDKILTYFGFTLAILIYYFSFFAEITFWDEFQIRFNFIAVDYLIYTYEVVKNINESYPLPILLLIMGGLVGLTIYLFERNGIFKTTFNNTTPFSKKLVPSIIITGVVIFFSFIITSKSAELTENKYNNELSKAGIYSFFAAFRNNELSFPEFYNTIDLKTAFGIVNSKLTNQNSTPIPNENSISHLISNEGESQKPNVIFICVESLSADFLGSFGNTENLTPTLDSLANTSILFTNLYATGTRTVRGMEAITLSIPPTPGRSIVKRQNNQGLFTIGEVFKKEGYQNNFFYGGDGYFDNMDNFFSGSGFNIIDRGRGFLPSGDITTTRTNIEDEEVTFENAWGVCDGDTYRKVIQQADLAYANKKSFFDFIMTTSNHKPYTYPDNKIDIPSGTGRNGAVKYTDFAIGEFLKEAKSKPWFENTVFIIMADHCASSAGKWELNVSTYHIPAMIINSKKFQPQKVSKLVSQIDLFPTLFSLLNWDYKSNFFGKDIFEMKQEDERAFIGNYRKLGLLKENRLLILGDQKQASFYQWDSSNNNLKTISTDTSFFNETVSFYQVADYLYTNDGLKVSK